MSTLSLRTQIREDYLTCPICFNKFNKPKALPCLHTFCEDCLRDYVVSRGYESTGCFPCPNCRTDTAMPENGVEGFPVNHLMSSLSDTVEKSAPPNRPVPKPRRSLGQPKPQETTPADDQTSPPPYSSVADTNPEAMWGGAEGQADRCPTKVCTNDSEPDWMVVARQDPSAPAQSSGHGDQTNNLGVTEYCVVSTGQPGSVPNPSSASQPQNLQPHTNQSALLPGHMRLPSQPPAYTYPGGALPGLPVYPDLNGPPTSTTNDTSVSSAPIGWNLNAHENMYANMGPPQAVDGRSDGHIISTHSPRETGMGIGQRPGRSSPQIYPTVPSGIEPSSTACTLNLLLKFGKQGSSVRDFLKPVGLAVSKEGNYIISDNGGDQNRIFIYNSGGELTTAFKCGCKVKDVTVTKKNEIFAAVHKNVSAIRNFTMAGQCKGEYGKFFTYEEPCGIAELKNGGAVLTGPQNHCVYVLTDQMKLATKFGRKGNGDGYFQYPGYIAVDSKDHIIVTDRLNNSVQVFNREGKFKFRFGQTGSNHGNFQAPLGVCVDDDDNIIVADSGNFRVEVFSSKGRWLSSVVSHTDDLGENVKPVNVAFTPTGNVAVLLRGPYFAEVRIYSTRHKQIVQNEGPVSTTSVWFSK